MVKTLKVEVERRGEYFLWFARVAGKQYARETRNANWMDIPGTTQRKIEALADGDSLIIRVDAFYAFYFNR